MSGGSAPRSASPSMAHTRQVVVRAAQKVFAENGYSGGRTLDIAAEAQVTERTVFRHFPTKAELFTAAVIQPFHSCLRDFIDEWRMREHGVLSARAEVHAFYARLLDVLNEHRGLVIALMAARAFEDPTGTAFPDLESQMAELLTDLEKVLEAETADRGFRGIPALNVRFIFGLAMSVTVHGDWLFHRGSLPSRTLLLDELTSFTLTGLGIPAPVRRRSPEPTGG